MLRLVNFHPSRADLLAYLDGEMPPQERQRIARHCATCPRCEANLAAEQRLRRDLHHTLPALGKRRPDDLTRLLPAILGEARKPPAAFNRLAVSVAVLLMLTLLSMLPAFGTVMQPPTRELQNVPLATATLSALEVPQAGTAVQAEQVISVGMGRYPPGKGLQNAPYLQYASPAPLPQATLEASFVPDNR